MNSLDQQYVDGNEQRFAAVAHTEPSDAAEMRAAIARHLTYLEESSADCTKSAQRGDGSSHMATAASVYAEVAAELRNTLGMDPL
jgi:hypothetical protein|tara:strand:- start:271 stop:525 length:255 start_codon:yes stop_codon:yes gene_type:complete